MPDLRRRQGELQARKLRMFTVNQTNREEHLASLPDDDIVVLFDRKCVFMCDGGARLPRAAELRTSIGEEELLVLVLPPELLHAEIASNSGNAKINNLFIFIFH